MNILIFIGILFIVFALISLVIPSKLENTNITYIIFYGNLIMANIYFATNHIVTILERG